jgi:hypothetical protein
VCVCISNTHKVSMYVCHTHIVCYVCMYVTHTFVCVPQESQAFLLGLLACLVWFGLVWFGSV